MPANLTPQYMAAEKRYREAITFQEKLAALEEMLSVMPKHKGTDRLQADVKRKIAKLKDQAERAKKLAPKRLTVNIPREGVGQVFLMGPPNTGKSQVLAALTNAKPEIADYPFTTRIAMPGMMLFENVQIQLVDTPPIAKGYTEKWLFPLIRAANGAALVLDPTSDNCIEESEEVLAELESAKIGLIGQKESEDESPGICRLRCLVVLNKADKPGAADGTEILNELYSPRFEVIGVSAKNGTKLEVLKRSIFELLGIMRVYCKSPGRPADVRDPVILDVGGTVLDFAKSIHKDFARNLAFARVWGAGVHDGQRVQRDHVLSDGDTVEMHI